MQTIDLYPISAGDWLDASLSIDDVTECRRFVDAAPIRRCIVIREPFLPPLWHGFKQISYQSSGYPGVGEYVYEPMQRKGESC